MVPDVSTNEVTDVKLIKIHPHIRIYSHVGQRDIENPRIIVDIGVRSTILNY